MMQDIAWGLQIQVLKICIASLTVGFRYSCQVQSSC